MFTEASRKQVEVSRSLLLWKYYLPSFNQRYLGPRGSRASLALGELSWPIPSLDAWVGLGAGGPWATVGVGLELFLGCYRE